jgi:hypothetical protein
MTFYPEDEHFPKYGQMALRENVVLPKKLRENRHKNVLKISKIELIQEYCPILGPPSPM